MQEGLKGSLHDSEVQIQATRLDVASRSTDCSSKGCPDEGRRESRQSQEEEVCQRNFLG